MAPYRDRQPDNGCLKRCSLSLQRFYLFRQLRSVGAAGKMPRFERPFTTVIQG